LLESCNCFLFRAWTPVNVRWGPRVGTFHIGRGRWQPLIDFDWHWREYKIGETPCRGRREENARNGKSQADHFVGLRGVRECAGHLAARRSSNGITSKVE
jgi:hypothetical protein